MRTKHRCASLSERGADCWRSHAADGVRDTTVEKIVYVQVLEVREGMAEWSSQSRQSRRNSWRSSSLCLRIAFRDGSLSRSWIFRITANQGRAREGLCLRSTSTSTPWNQASKKCRHRKRQKGKFGRDSEEGLLEAAMARARGEEVEFFEAVPQGAASRSAFSEKSGDVRVPHAERGRVVSPEGAGWLPLQCAACFFQQLPLFLTQS